MIDITGVDLVEFAKKVYELSSPQGLGFLHYTTEPLNDEEAKQYIYADKDDIILDMDYVKGRACKMHVRKEGNKWLIDDSWYDHTDRIYQQLLNHFNISKPNEKEHGCACNCIDCQSARTIESDES